MDEVYLGREQTEAKHIILAGYLAAFANKLINSYDIAYIDGFSGPWEAQTQDFSDTSFGIAVDVMLRAQKTSLGANRKPRNVKCFFVEQNKNSHAQLANFLAPYNLNANFEVRDFCGDFEAAIPEIESFVKGYFPLLFLDPKGWTGIPLEKLKPLLRQQKSEIIVNFMSEFIQRGVKMSVESTERSFDGLFGGPNWKKRLDPNLNSIEAALKLFKSTLKEVGNFKFVVDAEILMATKDRAHYHLVYGTKSYIGLKEFRAQQFKAQKKANISRASARRRKADQKTDHTNLTFDFEHTEALKIADARRLLSNLAKDVNATKKEARKLAVTLLQQVASLEFDQLAGQVLEKFVLKETHVKDICVDLAAEGFLENSWQATGKRKPDLETILRRSQR